jgi:hypothetical protein
MKRLFILLLFSTTDLHAQIKVPDNPLAIATLSSTTKTINFRLSWNQTEVVDSTMVAVFLSRDSVPVLYRKTKPIDTVSFSIPDDTTTYKFVFLSVRRGLASLPANVNFYFDAEKYYNIVSVEVQPRTIELLVGQTIQVCPFFIFNDGSVVMRNQDKDKVGCMTKYLNLYGEPLRKSIGARLRIANKECLIWETTDSTVATVVPEVCIPPSSV